MECEYIGEQTLEGSIKSGDQLSGLVGIVAKIRFSRQLMKVQQRKESTLYRIVLLYVLCCITFGRTDPEYTHTLTHVSLSDNS